METRVTKKISQQLLDGGKLPPQAIELEEAVLGAMLLESESIPVVLDILKTESFYKDCNSKIFQAIVSLHKKSFPADILTVTQELKRTGELEIVGGAYYISQLTSRIGSAANIEFHARIISQKYIARELIRIGTETINSAYSDAVDVFEMVDVIEKNITALTKNFTVGKVESMAGLWNQVKDKNEVLLTKKGLSGIPSGYPDLDAVTGGWQSPDLIILAARPAMGKTSLACNFARNASVDHNKPGAIFSLEMSSLQIATRIFALESNTSISSFTRRGIPHEQLIYIENDCARLINSNMYIDDTEGITLSELRSKARKLKREKHIEWMIIDYLQLMGGVKGNNNQQNREQEIASISRGLKALAKELKIPIIAMSQLSRAVESRGGDKRPILSDLRESGAIEQDADIVMFLHRPEYYKIMEDETGASTAGTAEVIFAKHRNGGIGTEKLKFIDYLTKFEPMDYDDPFANTPTQIKAPKLEPAKDFSEPIKKYKEDLPF